MTCIQCNKTIPVASCTQELIVGAVNTTNAYVQIRDITQNRIMMFGATIDPISSIVTIDVSDITFAENHSYEITIWDYNQTPPTQINFDNSNGDGVGGLCAIMRVHRHFISGGQNPLGYQTQTLIQIQ